MFALRRSLVPIVLLALLGVAPGTAARSAVPDAGDTVPRVGSEPSSPSMSADVAWPPPARGIDAPTALRARWMIRPDDPSQAQALVGEAGVELVARITRFDDLWILEAPADSSVSVRALWEGVGELVEDVSGTPALLASTRLIGVRDQVWSVYGLRGDVSSSVAILDSGCDTAHDDLGDPDTDDEDQPPAAGDTRDWVDAAGGLSGDLEIRVIGWHDVTDDLPQAVGPWDYHYHGTALASAAFGGGEVSDLHQGVAPMGRFVVVKTWNYEERWERWASDLLLGMDWVIENAKTYDIRACLIGATWPEDLGFGVAVDSLTARGISVIAPVGNELPSMGHPALLDDVIAVGATDVSGRLAAYSSPAPFDRPSSTLDVLAPGGSLLPEGEAIEVADNDPDDGYRGRAGSSLAAAHVAGAVSLIQQALLETGRDRGRSAARVHWLQDLLRATAVEVPGAEPGTVVLPRRDRIGSDHAEGFGLVQISAAVDAVRRILWPGDAATFVLDAPTEGPAAWAGRIPTRDDRPLEVELTVPTDADYDLMVYDEFEDGLSLSGWSARAGTGGSERVRVERPRSGWSVVVVRRWSGTGLATLRTRSEFLGADGWPVAVSSLQRSSPAVADLDDDGRPEVVAVNNASIDATAHTFHVWNADGSRFGVFPQTFFTQGRPGELTTPAIGRLGGLRSIITGSEFGDVLAVRATGEFAFIRTVASGPTTMPSLGTVGGQERILVGTAGGVVVLDAEGILLRTLATGAAVTEPVAVGDLDADGDDEVVAVDAAGRVHAFDIDGSALAGWPVELGGELRAPILVGDGSGAGAREVIVLRRDANAGLRLHRRDAAGLPWPGSPVLLPTAGAAVSAFARPVVARTSDDGPLTVFVSSLTGTGVDPVRSWSHRLDLDAGVETRETTVARAEVMTSILAPSLVQVLEPRVAELAAGGGHEVLGSLRARWSELFVAQPIRNGAYAGFQEWRDGRPVDLVPLEGDRDRAGTVEVIAPVLADLDLDNRPEWIVVRDRHLHVIGSRLPADLSTGWTRERGDPARRACVGCEEEIAVEAPRAPVALRLSAVPNPFNPRTELRVNVPGSGPARVRLHDLRGRRLREWTLSGEAAGERRLRMEALDAAGRPLASGVYLAIVDWRGERTSTRLVLVR